MTTTPDYKGVICVNESNNIQKLSEYGMIAPDGTWYPCEFGEHAALAGRIIMQNRIRLNLSDKEVLDMAYDWSGKGLDYLYRRGWIAVLDALPPLTEWAFPAQGL